MLRQALEMSSLSKLAVCYSSLTVKMTSSLTTVQLQQRLLVKVARETGLLPWAHQMMSSSSR